MNEHGAPLTDLVERDGKEFKRMLKKARKTREQFELEVVGRVQAFCEIHAERVSACLLRMDRGSVQLIVGTPDAFDFEISDCETVLELEAFDGGWTMFDVHQLPGNPPPEKLLDFGRFAANEAREESAALQLVGKRKDC